MAEKITLPATIAPEQVETGMTIRVHQKIKDITPSGDEKERIQVFEGLVLTVGGSGLGKTMTVRKISGNVGVEKIFPLNLPAIDKIEVLRKARTRRKHIGFVRTAKKKRMKEIKEIKLHKAKAPVVKEEAKKEEPAKEEKVEAVKE
ncbi:50S ribosomal protein L19 [Candidatus Uhrbacteria bacterium CG22_combo_CG10-13_8_21_14_all_47_17]|uniref:50S ribosomal protein L19 n=1 Tax=Candidatus Uhrbacteria bacterium CG22_combo_CG10-13_8_21_14_all_47_17 TaxID=1975041 RepID=A0A2H0BTT1_9BACT|nr:MAG: 50S ribosomal protein L19 [Candidatus Uhrbacteria bacterium CG22_combo_CG10-13_8_21_14_all_47_17]